MLPWHFPEDLPSILPQQRKTNPHKEQKITLSIPVRREMCHSGFPSWWLIRGEFNTSYKTSVLSNLQTSVSLNLKAPERVEQEGGW